MRYRYHDHPSRQNSTDIDGSIEDVKRHIADNGLASYSSIQHTQDMNKAESASKAWAVYQRRFMEIRTYGEDSPETVEGQSTLVTFLYIA